MIGNRIYPLLILVVLAGCGQAARARSGPVTIITARDASLQMQLAVRDGYPRNLPPRTDTL